MTDTTVKLPELPPRPLAQAVADLLRHAKPGERVTIPQELAEAIRADLAERCRPEIERIRREQRRGYQNALNIIVD